MTAGWQPAAVISITGFLDFQAEMAAAALTRQGYPAQAYIPCICRARINYAITRVSFALSILPVCWICRRTGRSWLMSWRSAGSLNKLWILPACFGAENSDGIAFLQQQLE